MISSRRYAVSALHISDARALDFRLLFSLETMSFIELAVKRSQDLSRNAVFIYAFMAGVAASLISYASRAAEKPSNINQFEFPNELCIDSQLQSGFSQKCLTRWVP